MWRLLTFLNSGTVLMHTCALCVTVVGKKYLHFLTYLVYCLLAVFSVAGPAYWDVGDDLAEMLLVASPRSVGGQSICAIGWYVSWVGDSMVWMVVPHDKELVYHYSKEALKSTEYDTMICRRFIVLLSANYIYCFWLWQFSPITVIDECMNMLDSVISGRHTFLLMSW